MYSSCFEITCSWRFLEEKRKLTMVGPAYIESENAIANSQTCFPHLSVSVAQFIVHAHLRVNCSTLAHMTGSLFEAGQNQQNQGSWIIANCDGGSRGNPGPAGYGVYIQDSQGNVIAELSEFLGKRTNNYAEYSGLLAALNYALQHDHRRLRVVADSELMVRQIKGQYKVNSPELRPLYEEAKRRISKLEAFDIQHVLRGKNRHADRLANLAMDSGGKKVSQGPEPQKEAELKDKPQVLRGFVKNGVVHLLGGELPDGVFVKVMRE
jgi:ribonuclease HI